METPHDQQYEVHLPSGQSVMLRRPILKDWLPLDTIYARCLIGLSLFGELTEDLVREQFPGTLMQGFLADQRLAPDQPSQVVEFLSYFLPGEDAESLLRYNPDRFKELISTIMDNEAEFFQIKRLSLVMEIRRVVDSMTAGEADTPAAGSKTDTETGTDTEAGAEESDPAPDPIPEETAGQPVRRSLFRWFGGNGKGG